MARFSFVGSLKGFFFGRPIPSHQAHHERLSRVTGLAVLSSDALSSVAYATEEILRALMLAGTGALWLASPISGVIAFLLVIVAISYRQTVHAFPKGGGAYSVARENLGVHAGLVAAAALLIDYVLTVAVSIAASTAAVTSAFPHFPLGRVSLALILLFILTVGNLRGIRESGRIFSIPTYAFIASMVLLIVAGLIDLARGGGPEAGALMAGHTPAQATATGTTALTLFLVLRAFANGCTALTGVEAIPNAVPAFRPPEARNAASTLLTMAVLAVTMFLGITFLASAYGIIPAEHETVISQLARAIFGGRGIPYYIAQAATMLILMLAANTAYSDFPRLASIVANDRFLPRQFRNQGDRLAFSNGILFLSVTAGVLIALFAGDTHALIPLYMVGVFVSFTLSQTGLVRKMFRERPAGWRHKAVISGVGATLTCIVLGVVTVTKFLEGAWMVLGMIVLMVAAFKSISRHYQDVGKQLSLDGWSARPPDAHTVIIPIGGVHRAVVTAIHYARMLSSDVRAVYVDVGRRPVEDVRKEWERHGMGIPLTVVPSPYRSLIEPILDFIDTVQKEIPHAVITVVLPEFVPARWWHHLLHNQRALLLKGALLFRPSVVVCDVPYHLTR